MSHTKCIGCCDMYPDDEIAFGLCEDCRDNETDLEGLLDIALTAVERELTRATRGIVMDEYYLQDKRTIVGNDLMFWAKDGKGYTSDISKAHVFTKEEAVRQHASRETDIPWPKEYIDARTRPAVDCQYVDIDTALQGTGIVLIKPEKPKKETYRCYGCGQFMSERQYYSAPCSCGTDNRP